MKRIIPAALLLSVLAGCASTSDLDETRQQIAEVNRQAQDRLGKIETKLSNEKLLDLVSQLEAIKAELAKLRGETEVLNYNVQTTQKRQNDLYNDLDSRLAKFEGGSAARPAATTGGASGAVGQVAPETQNSNGAEFEKALGVLRLRDFPRAIEALQRFLSANPGSAQVPDAEYWLGVAHTAQRQYDAAIDTHRRFVDKYPDHPKAPDALRNIANCQRDLGQKDIAKATLRRLIKLYPKSVAAQRAKDEIKRL